MIDLDFIKDRPLVKRLDTGVDYLKLYFALKNKFQASYMFESLVLPKQQARYYTIGFDPMYTFSAHGNELTIKGKDKTEKINSQNPYYELKKYLPKLPDASPYQGGLLGYFSYEAANYIEPVLQLPEHPDFPVFEFGLYIDGLVYDSATGRLEYYTFGADRSHIVSEIINGLDEVVLPKRVESVKDEGLSVEKPEYLKTVENTLGEIRAGNSFQVEVGFKKDYQITGDKFAIYNRLREVNPSPYMYYVHFGEREIFGASPELVVSMTAGKILTTPAAGTVRRGKDESEDDRLARQLLNDPKEVAEHAMLVDLHRNDISKVSKYGSVKVTELMHLMKFKYVQHIVSDIIGEIRPGKDSFDLLAGVMPCGVLTGAPKIETMKIIRRNENLPRGPYGGAIGRFSYSGDCVFAMPIRGLFCAGDKCFTQACSGVVFDSVPEKEYDEVIAKLAGMEQTIKDVS